jgi:hypothetical protein
MDTLSVGDTVRKKDGTLFGNGKKFATVAAVEGREVRLLGIPVWMWRPYLEKVGPLAARRAADIIIADDVEDNDPIKNAEALHQNAAEWVASKPTGKIASDGGTTDYYKLPAHATELRHLIAHKGMNFHIGNIFKAAYRLGEKVGIDHRYDLKKIISMAQFELEELDRNGRKATGAQPL